SFEIFFAQPIDFSPLDFMVYSDEILDVNHTYNRLTDAYNITDEGNYENAGNDLLAWADEMTFGEWNTLSVTFTAETDTIYFQSSWVNSIKFANFTLQEIDGSIIELPVIGEYENAAEIQALVMSDGEITVTLTITDESIISAENISVFTASYNDSAAESVSALTKTIINDGAVFTGTVGESYKIFIWDDNMRPLTQSAN
ncbi:MAG: hypothetical protein LUG52_05555, partial [Clostridia bacterium]|nr:hypothetical protein [Clostridia bacterium]